MSDTTPRTKLATNDGALVTASNPLPVVVESGGGGGGGGAVTVADGADVTQGAVANAAYSSGSGTVVSLLKGLFGRLRGGQATKANSMPVVLASDTDSAATGTLTATQATANTPVAGGTVACALGGGQGTWAGQIIASNGGGLGSVLQFESSEDGGTTWNSTSVRTAALTAGIGTTATLAGTTQTLTWRGSCAGWTNVRVRCSSYTASDVLAVSVTASTASDIPTGVAQDGTDSSDGNATQATAGVGIRGWLSTLVSLFRAGTAKVNLTAGSALIGKVGIDQTTPGTTNGVQVNAALPAGENHVGAVGGHTVTAAAAQFTRPNDTTAYASGDLVANNVTAGSVVALQFTVARVAAGSGMVRRARIRTSATSVTNASFRLHLYKTSPTPANGDNGAWSTDQALNYLGSFDITLDKAFTDGAAGNGLPSVGNELNFQLASGQVVYGLLEARAAYTPTAQETFDVAVEALQN